MRYLRVSELYKKYVTHHSTCFHDLDTQEGRDRMGRGSSFEHAHAESCVTNIISSIHAYQCSLPRKLLAVMVYVGTVGIRQVDSPRAVVQIRQYKGENYVLGLLWLVMEHGTHSLR